MSRGTLSQAAMQSGGAVNAGGGALVKRPAHFMPQRFSRSCPSLDSSHKTLITAKSTAKPKPRTQVKYHMI
ncbi:MAG: hypothetical protein ABFE02_07655 [Sulfuricella sp.]